MQEEIRKIREFNRFYTGMIGLLEHHVVNSPFSLPEARVLFELHHAQPCTASDLLQRMEIDKGYLSRILKAFERGGILKKLKSSQDKRSAVLKLTARGEKEFNGINDATVALLSQLLKPLTVDELQRLIRHMEALRSILERTRK